MPTSPKQGSAEWLELRRHLITSTDLPIILGLSPYTSEGTLARRKLGIEEPDPPSLAMRIGLAVEPVIQAEYEARTSTKLRRFHTLVTHPTITWAAASPDWRVIGEDRLVEGKWTQAKRWDDEELPQDVEAQVHWALGCTGYGNADVAALIGGGRDLRIVPVQRDDNVFANLVEIAADFRARMEAGGPFTESVESLKRRWPADDGEELVADEELTEAVVELLRLRAGKSEIEEACDRLEVAIKSRMATATRLSGPGWSITWKRTKDSEVTDWKSIADGLLRQLADDQRQAMLGIHTVVKPGFRPFRLAVEKGSTTK